MEELQAKWTFDQGGFAKALIAPTPMGAGYHLHLVKFGKQSETIVLDGVVSRNRRNFRHASSTPSTRVSRSITLPSL